MITFIVVLVLVLVAVDLLVRFVIDPFLSASNKKNKVAKSFTSRFDPTVKLAIETMYDGGKPHNEKDSKNITKDENIPNDTSAGLKQ